MKPTIIRFIRFTQVKFSKNTKNILFKNETIVKSLLMSSAIRFLKMLSQLEVFYKTRIDLIFSNTAPSLLRFLFYPKITKEIAFYFY